MKGKVLTNTIKEDLFLESANANTASGVVWIVEDNYSDQILLKEILADFNLNDIWSNNGLEALKQLESYQQPSDNSIIPSLIITDYNMPGINGAELVHQIRQSSLFIHTPIVVFSTSNHLRDIELSYQAGANAFVFKPFDFDHYQLCIEKMIAYWRVTT